MLQAIHIQLIPSKPILGLLCGVSIIACAIVLTLPILLILKLVIIALIVATSTYYILRDALFWLPYSWKTLDVDSKGNLTLLNKSSQKFSLTPAPSSFIHAGCSVLNFQRDGYKFALPPVILLPSADNADEFRRLRVWLRWFKHAENQDDLPADLVE